MKQIIYIILISILLIGCNKERIKRDVVKERFPNAEIYNLKESFKFIVIDSTGIYYVSCSNLFNSDITEERLIKKY